MADNWEVAVAEVRGEVRTLASTVAEHKADDERRWDDNRETHQTIFGKLDIVDKALTSRLPVWATFLIGGLMSLATWGLTK